MMIFKSTLALLVLTSSCMLTQVIAHRPATQGPSCDNDYGSSQTALPLPDPTISWSFKHYLDCSHRAVWIQIRNATPDQRFYVGVGIPTQDRFSAVRANALIIGPGLPALTAEEWNQVPEEVRNDPVWNGDNIGAYFHASPEDQSTCDHLGTVMNRASSVVHGRCDFFERFGRTHSWRVLDADNNVLPQGNGATYHVAVFLQDHTSAKLGIALGTWVENFITRYARDQPSCTRDLRDFSEKRGEQDGCFPVVSCPMAQRPIGCEDAVDMPDAPVCDLGQVCDEMAEECVIANITYKAPSMGACAGELCPAAVKTWEDINYKMHVGMMDLEYSGNPDLDFVRGMIPHHIGSVDMCEGLLQSLTCTEIEGVDNLEGLVHFCNHVKLEQEIEVGGMLAWLDARNLSDAAPCSSDVVMVGKQANSHSQHGGHTGMSGVAMASDSCGNITAPSSEKLIQVSEKMHDLMAVRYSCDHSIDFVRMMLPHHAGAVDMCDILMETTTDDYLVELCDNITLTQRAEIAWMYQWLDARDMAPVAHCQANCGLDAMGLAAMAPCEDTLSTSSFCHGIAGKAQDGYCRCGSETFATSGYSCGETAWVDGFGLFVPNILCKRSCGKCPMGNRPLWVPGCSASNDGDSMADHGHLTVDKAGENAKPISSAASAGKHQRYTVLSLVLAGITAMATVL